MIRRGWWYVAALVVAGAGVGVVTGSPFFGRIGPQPDGTGITPNHWLLMPAGLQVEVGDRPLGMAETSDGRYLLISNNGQGVQSLVVFDTSVRNVVHVLPYTSP